MHFIIVLTSLITTHEAQSPIGGGSTPAAAVLTVNLRVSCAHRTIVHTGDIRGVIRSAGIM